MTLRRKSWPVLTWGGVLAVWGIYPFGVQASLQHGNRRDVWLVCSAFLMVTAILRRIGSCRIELHEDVFVVNNLFFAYRVPHSSVVSIAGGASGSLDLVTRDRKVISPFGFGGSLVDSVFKTSENAAQVLRDEISESNPINSK
jgi:hypothetical protein